MDAGAPRKPQRTIERLPQHAQSIWAVFLRISGETQETGAPLPQRSSMGAVYFFPYRFRCLSKIPRRTAYALPLRVSAEGASQDSLGPGPGNKHDVGSALKAA